jgi:glycosyltransferase involved in cell wall biosynthesis
MNLVCLASIDPNRMAHGMGLIVNNTARVLLENGSHRVTFGFLADRSERGDCGGAAGLGQLRFRFPEAAIDAWYERPALGRGDFLRALAGGPLTKVERGFLDYAARRSAEADVVVWFGFFWDPVSRMLPGVCRCPVVIHANDSIALVERSREAHFGRTLRALAAGIEERAVLGAGYRGAVYCSPIDAAVGQSLARPGLHAGIRGLANGVDVDTFRPDTGGGQRRRRSGPLELLFSGVMNFEPNVRAVRMLVEEILPRVSAPVALRIVGKNPAPEVLRLAGGAAGTVTATGAVEDIVGEYRRADLFVAPIYRSTGTKNKVLEALACGLPVVTTESVAEAFTPRPAGLLAADSPARFAQTIEALAGRRELLESLGEAGVRSVGENFTWERRTTELTRLCAALAGSESTRATERDEVRAQ